MNNPSKVDEYVSYAPIIFVRDAFYVFGGDTDISDSDTIIAKLDADLTWTKVGELNKGRHGHNVIFDGSFALVVGGYDGIYPTEKCDLSTTPVNCTNQSPELEDYSDYPELFIVAPNFCKK